jgi:uncharacterized membrane protein HdeD (DUF308 family)
MNVIKRLLNVITIFGVFMVIVGIYTALTQVGDRYVAAGFGIFLLGLVLTFNYILFQNISVWNEVEKNKS